jgi:hypothetical protein
MNIQEKIKCDFCGKCQELQKFKIKKKSKRFCSQECSKMFENNSKNGQTDKKNGKNWVCILKLHEFVFTCIVISVC